MKRKERKNRIEEIPVLKPGFTEINSMTVPKMEMPKDMGDWLDFAIRWGCCVPIRSGNGLGYAMKSRDCTVLFFPHWNCDKQFADLVNTFERY